MEWQQAGATIAQVFGWSITGVLVTLIAVVAVVLIAAVAWAGGVLVVGMAESFGPASRNVR